MKFYKILTVSLCFDLIGNYVQIVLKCSVTWGPFGPSTRVV